MSAASVHEVSAVAYDRRDLADGSAVISLGMKLPPGWSKDEVLVEFLIPIAFPAAQPDCFFTDIDLRLASGAQPTNTDFQPIAGAHRLWFSWHLASWTPGIDSVETYIRFIERRFREPR